MEADKFEKANESDSEEDEPQKDEINEETNDKQEQKDPDNQLKSDNAPEEGEAFPQEKPVLEEDVDSGSEGKMEADNKEIPSPPDDLNPLPKLGKRASEKQRRRKRSSGMKARHIRELKEAAKRAASKSPSQSRKRKGSKKGSEDKNGKPKRKIKK